MKMVDTGEQKMVNALMYFAQNVKYPYKTKMFKLLYYLDFLHFKQVGIPVTNQRYETFVRGPVPKKLFVEIEEGLLSDYFNERVFIQKKLIWGLGKEGYKFVSLGEPDMDVFSEREIKVLENIAKYFKFDKAKDMIKQSHLEDEPWYKVREEKGLNKEIDYMLALDMFSYPLDTDYTIPKGLAKERLDDYEEMRRLFS